MSSMQLARVTNMVRTAMNRHNAFGGRGLLDPESERTRFVNPRYQEACLTLALAAEHGVGVPEGMRRTELEQAAIHSMDVWFRSQHRSGGVRSQPNLPLDPQATAYGLFAVTRTLVSIGDRVPPAIRSRALKGVKRAAYFLARSPVPPGLETRPLRYAALTSAAKWLGSTSLASSARSMGREAEQVLRKALTEQKPGTVDAGAISLALAYLVLAVEEGRDEDLELWRMIGKYCLGATTASGLCGGGAEASLASLPITSGYYLTASRIEENARVALLLEKGWETGWYNGLLDPDVPWLTPLGYLFLYGLLRRPDDLPQCAEGAAVPDSAISENGTGRLDIGDWTLRLALGGTIGWMHHNPSGSTRLFGSPSGLALREGPWIIEGNRLRQPSLAGRYTHLSNDSEIVEGDLYSIPIPGAERSPRRVGFPRWRGKKAKSSVRLAPQQKPSSGRASSPVHYRREFEIKDGALTIETHVPGRVMHRLPMIWPGGFFGQIVVDKTPMPLQVTLQERRVREIVFEGGIWPTWVVRFDKPVDLLYEPIHGMVTSGPMRYLSAAAGAFDIIATDRLHMAWRVV